MPLALSVAGGLAVCVTAGFATTIVTPTPERAQITTRGTWAPGLLGLPAALPGIVSLVGWTAAFAVLAQRRFRWDPRVRTCPRSVGASAPGVDPVEVQVGP